MARKSLILIERSDVVEMFYFEDSLKRNIDGLMYCDSRSSVSTHPLSLKNSSLEAMSNLK